MATIDELTLDYIQSRIFVLLTEVDELMEKAARLKERIEVRERPRQNSLEAA
jgi:uncharacterized protein YoxC